MLITLSVLWLSSTFGFQKHLLKCFSTHLHSPVDEPGTFQLPGSSQGCETCCFLVSLNQSTARGQLYSSHTHVLCFSKKCFVWGSRISKNISFRAEFYFLCNSGVKDNLSPLFFLMKWSFKRVNLWNKIESIGEVPPSSRVKQVKNSAALFWAVFGFLGLFVNVSLARNEVTLWLMPELVLVFSFKT